jgi:hypothetical protein
LLAKCRVCAAHSELTFFTMAAASVGEGTPGKGEPRGSVTTPGDISKYIQGISSGSRVMMCGVKVFAPNQIIYMQRDACAAPNQWSTVA